MAKINLKYEPKDIGERNISPTVINIFVENVTSKKGKHAFFFDGLENSNIQNIFVKDCKFDGVKKENIANNVEIFNKDNVFINGVLFKDLI